MVGPLMLIAAATGAEALPGAQAQPASVSARPEAVALFERDWVLMNWALKFYDKDRDVLLSTAEAAAATGAFRSLADANGDARITREEYRAARAFILARY